MSRIFCWPSSRASKASPTRLPPCSLTRLFKLALSICCATPWTSCPGRIARASRRRSRRFTAPQDADAAEKALAAFEAGPWGQRYPAIGQSWRRAWGEVIPFFAFPDEVRRIVYTTNAIEALNSKLRRAVRTRGHFPGDEAAMKLLYLVLNHAAEEWKRPPREWFEAKTQFAIIFGERFAL